MIEIFISLESAILAELKNVFISILAFLVTKLRYVLLPQFEAKVIKNRNILAQIGVTKYIVTSLPI